MDGIVIQKNNEKSRKVTLPVATYCEDESEQVARYVNLLGRMIAKNDGTTFSNGSKFATVFGILELEDNPHPMFIFKGMADRVECFRCREVK